MKNNSEKLKKPSKINKKQDEEKHSPIYYILNTILWVVVLGVFTYSILNTIDQKTGFTFLPNHTAVIVSESMSYVNDANTSYLDKNIQHINKYDVIYTTNYNSYEEIDYLDRIVYMGQSGTLVCHRVVDKYTDNGINYIVTRGDANSTNDTPFAYAQVRGRVSQVIPKAGYVVLFFQSWYFIMALCFSIFFILLGTFIYNMKTDKKKLPEVKTDDIVETNVEEIKSSKSGKKSSKSLQNSDIETKPKAKKAKKK
ncbi:MAG: hypothetical protein MJ227_02105 [Bacilli bacterium]|nr:hypothetical protein [Bacilli bacterium]